MVYIRPLPEVRMYKLKTAYYFILRLKSDLWYTVQVLPLNAGLACSRV